MILIVKRGTEENSDKLQYAAHAGSQHWLLIEADDGVVQRIVVFQHNSSRPEGINLTVQIKRQFGSYN